VLDSNGHVIAVMVCDFFMVLLFEYCERSDDLAASDLSFGAERSVGRCRARRCSATKRKEAGRRRLLLRRASIIKVIKCHDNYGSPPSLPRSADFSMQC
jgi:hypothetical protein